MPGSPFVDERVRQAASMSLDRDLLSNTFGNVEKYKKEGIEVPTRWNSSIYAGESYWIDPKDEKTYGDDAKCYKYNPAEARKLITAAGVTPPLDTKYHYPVDSFAPPFDKMMEVLHGDVAGQRQLQGRASDLTNYTPTTSRSTSTRRASGKASPAHATAARPEVDVLLVRVLQEQQSRSGHLMDDGKPDTVLDDLFAKQRAETGRRRSASAIVQDIQKRVASKMYFMQEPGQALGFTPWPWLQNFGLWRSKEGGSQAGAGLLVVRRQQTSVTLDRDAPLSEAGATHA